MDNIYSNGTAMASQRSLLRALGWSESEMKKPLIGLAYIFNEVPSNAALICTPG